MEKFDVRQRLLLVIALSFGFVTVMQLMFAEPQKPAAVSVSSDGGAQVAAAADGGAAGEQSAALLPPVPALAADGGAVEAAAAEPPQPLVPVREIARRRADMTLAFTTEGAALKALELTGQRERAQQKVSILDGFRKLFGAQLGPPPQMKMVVPAEGQAGTLAVSIGGAQPVSARTRYEVLEETDRAVGFRVAQGPWEIVKRYSWEDKGYGFAMDVTVKNTSATQQTGELGIHAARHIAPGSEESSSLFGGIGNEASVGCRVADDYKRLTPQGHAEGGIPILGCGAEMKHTVEEKGPVHFVDLDMQYFLAALYLADGPKDGRCVSTALPTVRSSEMHLPLDIAAGQEVTYHFGAFMGPKDFEVLKAAGPAGLERTVDFGLWAVICKVLLSVLQFFHRLVGNWGLAIILLTVSVKILLLPLTHKAMVSAEAMKKLQPKMEEIKKKYPDDRERQNVEVMKLYQEAKVNPLGGCLPLFLQLPIWAALFTTLRTSYDLYGEPFVGPVWTDLTYKDPTYILPLALGITMIITQRLQPQMMDKQQAFIFTWVMPIFFTGMMMNYPAGLALYIFSNNLLSILQQFLLRKYLEKKGIAAPRPKGPDKPPKGPSSRLKESAS